MPSPVMRMAPRNRRRGDGEIVADGELAGFSGRLLGFWVLLGHGLPFSAGFGCQ